jgi:hypothetical protein
MLDLRTVLLSIYCTMTCWNNSFPCVLSEYFLGMSWNLYCDGVIFGIDMSLIWQVCWMVIMIHVMSGG